MNHKKITTPLRGKEATTSIHDAALHLAEELGPENVTIEKIAESANVAKTTIYRRWPNAAAVIMDAFLTEIRPVISYIPQAKLSETFELALIDFSKALVPSRKDLLLHLIAAAQSEPDLSKAFWDSWIKPRREEAHKAMYNEGLTRAEEDVIIDLLFGAFYYRLLIPYAEIDEAWIKAIVKRVLPD